MSLIADQMENDWKGKRNINWKIRYVIKDL